MPADRSVADTIEHCIQRLEPRAGDRILELCCGTGWTSRVLARRGAAVLGVDPGERLLDAARAMARAEGLRAEYRLAAPEALPFEDGSFDTVVSTCGVLLTGSPNAAAREIARVCRTGGHLALSTWTSDGSVSRSFEVIRRYLSPSPTATRPSPFEWGRTERIRELFAEAFQLRHEAGVSYYREPSCEAAWESFAGGYGGALVASIEPERRRALREELTTFYAGFSTELGICMPREYIVTIGVRTRGAR